MIATWMLYCSMCALALALAALLAERLLIAGRAPIRLVWIGAVTLSLLIPGVALRFARHVVIANDAPAAMYSAGAPGSAGEPAVVVPSIGSEAAVPAPESSASGASSLSARAGESMMRWDQALLIAWVTLSLALVINFLGGIITLVLMRRRWTLQTVHGVPVYISDQTGPAVVGALSPSIVLPRWVLSLEPAQLALMLRHEQEHRRAGDGRLITLARLALIVMPWNLALWWQVVRLRVAVEMDCDARVLQDADARTYGDLLLEVAGAKRGPRMMEATAFAERATQLERRIRMLPRHRVRTTGLAQALAMGIALAAVSIAWVAPSPPVPERAPSLLHAIAPMATGLIAPGTPAQDSTQRIAAGTASRNAPRTDSTARSKPRPFASSSSLRDASRDSSRGASRAPMSNAAVDSLRTVPVLPDTDTIRPPRPRIGRWVPGPQQVDSLFKRLFEGISLSAEQQAEARRLLTVREQQGDVRLVSGSITLMGNFAKATEVQSRRDSTLRLLLTNDADRAAFDARRTARGAGGRGRSGGGGADSLSMLPAGAGGRGAGGGGRGGRGDSSGARVGGGRSGGGARGNINGTARVVTQSDAVYHRFFDGIALNAVQDSSARAIITRAQRESMELTRYVAPYDLKVVRTRDNLQTAASDSALLAIVSNPTDRAKLHARLRTPP